jgi:hypothetical protein
VGCVGVGVGVGGLYHKEKKVFTVGFQSLCVNNKRFYREQRRLFTFPKTPFGSATE